MFTMVLHNLLMESLLNCGSRLLSNRTPQTQQTTDLQKRFNFPACGFFHSNRINHSLKKKEQFDLFFFKVTNNKDYISMLYLLYPSSWRVDLLSVIYLLPYWPISGGGCARLQVREWLLSTNSSLRAWEKNDSESCVERLINSVFMPREKAALLLPAQQGLPSIRPSGFFSKDNEPFCI